MTFLNIQVKVFVKLSPVYDQGFVSFIFSFSIRVSSLICWFLLTSLIWHVFEEKKLIGPSQDQMVTYSKARTILEGDFSLGKATTGQKEIQKNKQKNKNTPAKSVYSLDF